MKQRNRAFDALKGIAITGVVMTHAGLCENEILTKISNAGARGVQLFFILSVYFMFVSLNKIALEDRSFQSVMIKKWYIKKFIRIIPLYYFFNAIFLMINGTTHTYWLGSHQKISILNIICNFVFLHGFNPFYINSINLNWYIADLAILILIAPWLYKMINSIEKAIALTLGSSIICYLSSMLIMCIPFGVDDEIWHAYWNVFSVWAELPIICLGIVLFYLFHSKVQYFEKVLKNKKISYCMFFYSCYMLGVLILSDMKLKGISIYFLYGIVFSMIFVSLMIYNIPIVVNKFWAIIGEYSYGMYLSHFIVLSVLKPILSKTKELMNGKHMTIFSCGVFGMIMILSFIISFIATKMIEKPFIGRFDKFWNSKLRVRNEQN